MKSKKIKNNIKSHFIEPTNWPEYSGKLEKALEQIQKDKTIDIIKFKEQNFETVDTGGHLKTFYTATILYREI